MGLNSVVVIVDGIDEGELRLFGVVVVYVALRIWAYCVVVVLGAVVVQPLSVLRMIYCKSSCMRWRSVCVLHGKLRTARVCIETVFLVL